MNVELLICSKQKKESRLLLTTTTVRSRYLRLGRERKFQCTFPHLIAFSSICLPISLSHIRCPCVNTMINRHTYKRTNEWMSKRRFLRQTSSASRPFPVLSHSLARSLNVNIEFREREKEKEMKVFIGEQCWMSRALRSSSRCNQHEKVGVPKMQGSF